MDKRLVYAKFLEGHSRTKEYVWIGFEELNEGDTIVVDTSYGKQVAIVTRCEPWSEGSKATKCVVGKVNNSKYLKYMAVEALMKDLEKKLAARAKKLQSIALYEMLAKDDPEMRELVDQYKELMNG